MQLAGGHCVRFSEVHFSSVQFSSIRIDTSVISNPVRFQFGIAQSFRLQFCGFNIELGEAPALHLRLTMFRQQFAQQIAIKCIQLIDHCLAFISTKERGSAFHSVSNLTAL